MAEKEVEHPVVTEHRTIATSCLDYLPEGVVNIVADYAAVLPPLFALFDSNTTLSLL